MIVIICPKCESEEVFDNGYNLEKLNLLCKNCNNQFYLNIKAYTWERWN